MRGAATLAAVALAASSWASEPPRFEIGSPRELRGVHRVYVAAEDTAHRTELSVLLRAEAPEIELVSDAAEAEAILVVTFVSETMAEATPAGGCTPCQEARRWSAPPQSRTKAIASVVRSTGPDVYRKLMTVTATNPATSIVMRQVVHSFVMAYRKANRR